MSRPVWPTPRTGFSPRGLRASAILAALIVFVGVGRGQEADTNAGPLFKDPDRDRLLYKPQKAAAAAVGNGLAPRTGPLNLLAILRAGESGEIGAWIIQDPLADPHVRRFLGTSTLVLMGGIPDGSPTLTELALLKTGDHFDCWALINTDEVRPLPAVLLERVQDKKPIPALGTLESDALNQAVIQANRTSARAFEKAARRDVAYVHLNEEPAKHRGEIVSFEGRLLSVVRWDPPLMVKQAGVRDWYEAWVIDDETGGARFKVLFTELPPGIELNKPLNRSVSLAGYFFKKYQYVMPNREDPKEPLYAPLIVAHTLTLLPVKATPEEETVFWAKDLMPWYLGGLLGVLGVVAVLIVWMRRGDRRVYRRLEAARTSQFVEPTPDAVPVARPVQEPENQEEGPSLTRAPTSPTPDP